MRTKLQLFINYIQKLSEVLDNINKLNNEKKELLLSEYQINSLLEIVSREEFYSRELATVQKSINSFIQKEFVEFELHQYNLTQILNCIVDYKEEYEMLLVLKNKIDQSLKIYSELKKINTMLLQTESGYYNHILKNLEKETTLNKNNKQRMNLCNTLA